MKHLTVQKSSQKKKEKVKDDLKLLEDFLNLISDNIWTDEKIRPGVYFIESDNVDPLARSLIKLIDKKLQKM